MQYGYVYAGIFCLIGILLAIRMGKINKVFYFAAGIFEVMAVWWLVNSLYPDLNMFHGTWGIVFRGVMLVTLVVTCYVFYKERTKPEKQDEVKKLEDKTGKK